MRPVRLALLLGLVVALGACITPSIPIPPPDPAMMQFSFTGDVNNTFATFHYPANVNYVDAIVIVYDRNKGKGVLQDTDADGSVTTDPLRVDLGDDVVVSFQRDDQTVSTCVRVREGAQSATDYCGP